MSASIKAGRQDFYPNFMSFSMDQGGADTFVTVKINTPIPRITIQGSRATVMELLWIDMECKNLLLNAVSEAVTFGMTTGTPRTDRSDISEGSTIFNLTVRMQMLTTGAGITVEPWRYNFQTQDGFGYLLATDSFNAYLESNATGVALVGAFRLFYRFVQIPVQEYIGIVQSQQAAT